ncbi:MAG: hypothetical protein R3D71_06515 [Rickettsiales bacterium]
MSTDQRNIKSCKSKIFVAYMIEVHSPSKNKNLCTCNREIVCGMNMVDKEKFPDAFVRWSENNSLEYKEKLVGMNEAFAIAIRFVEDSFACDMDNPYNLIQDKYLDSIEDYRMNGKITPQEFMKQKMLEMRQKSLEIQQKLQNQ